MGRDIKSRLVDHNWWKAVVDDYEQGDFCVMGSDDEYDVINDWSRSEMVEAIQRLDKEKLRLERKNRASQKIIKSML